MHLLRRLKANGMIRVLDRTDLTAVDGDYAVLSKRGEIIRQPATAVLLAHGLVPDAELSAELCDIGVPTVRIGDAAQVARIGEAVRDAYRAVHDLRRLVIQSEPIAC